MKNKVFRLLFPLLCLIVLAGASPLARSGEAGRVQLCAVCGQALSGNVWRYGDKLVCEQCSRLPTKCSVCGLPVRQGYATTSDGRVICAADSPNVVLTAESSRESFREVQGELSRLTKGEMELRFPHVAVNLFDVDYWNRADRQPAKDKMHSLGFSQTRILSDRFVHSVLVFSGQTKESVAAVCAHELTHLWINENKNRFRLLDADTVEAVCEVVAYRLMFERGDAEQMERIRSNPYTHGKILKMIEWEERFGLSAIFEWIRSGTEPAVNGGALVQLREASIISSMRALPQFHPAPAPDTLILKGLSGSKKRRFALINDHMFMQGEKAAVRRGEGTVLVSCLRIHANSVEVQVEGEEASRTLRFGE